MIHLKTITFFTLLAFSSHAQLLRDHDVDESTIKPWIEDTIANYSDRYIFQPNDGNYLIIIVDDTNVAAQIHHPGHWTQGGYALELGEADSSEVATHAEYIPLTGVKISEGKFISDQYSGEFITFISAGVVYKGIKVYDSWSIWPGYKYEIGVKRNEDLLKIYKGDYPGASLKILDSLYLTQYSKRELKLMRNEIYARYKYKFKPNGEVENYFLQQEWYTSTCRYKEVEHMFTWIEWRNIELIKKIEQIK